MNVQPQYTWKTQNTCIIAKGTSKVFFKSFQKLQNRMTVAQSADTCNDLQTETAGDTKQEGNKSIEEMAEK